MKLESLIPDTEVLTRDRAHPKACMQFMPGQGTEPFTPAVDVLDPVQLAGGLKFLTSHLAPDHKVDAAKAKTWVRDCWSLEHILDNVNAAVAIEKIYDSIVQRAGFEPNVSLMPAVYGYLIETRLALPAVYQDREKERWDVVDIADALQALAKQHGFAPKHEFPSTAGHSNLDNGLPKPEAKPLSAIHAPFTYWHLHQLRQGEPPLAEARGKVPGFVNVA